ncbi:MAG: MFS transporter [Chloroflexi bacterium]|nr:MFS transporter [Chloroflexota bacterium]
MTVQVAEKPRSLPIPLPKGVYYGWVIVAVVFLTNMVGASMNGVVFSMFIVPMRQELGVSLGTMAWGLTVSQLCAGFMAPITGPLIDRYGTRWMGVATGVICGGALISLYFADNIWLMYLRFAITGITGLGTPGGNLITIVPAGNWFVAKRGRAMAIARSGMGLGTTLGVLIAQVLIQMVGWRMTWVIFGLLIWITMIPAYGLLMRRRPEDLGLHPDGALTAPAPVQARAAAGPQPKQGEVDWTPREAIRTWVLWFMIAAFTLNGFAGAAAIFLRVPYWTQLGISPQTISYGVATDPFTVLTLGLVFGFLTERYAVRFMAVVGGIGRAISMLPLLFMPGHAASVYAHNITWGIGSAGFATTQTQIVPTYFGRRAQGTIMGIQVPFNIAAAAMGAPLAGYLVDGGMNIDLVWWFSCLGMLIPGLAFFFMKPPKMPATKAG